MIENEMIEEMGSVYDIKEVKELHDDLLKCLSYDEWSSREYNTDVVDYDDTAYGLYSIGYRKAPDGAVMLLVGKDNQALDKTTIEYFVRYNEQVRKETAREILRLFIKYSVDKEIIGCGVYDVVNGIAFAKEIYEKYGVVVE